MKIICIGRNYVEHAKEMSSPLPSSPIFFFKPDTSICKTKNFYHPKFTSDLHYECEVVIRIDKVGKNIQTKFANTYYSQFTLGIDFTARDIQKECKKAGLPWEKAKGFDFSAPISNTWIDIEKHPENIKFSLLKKGDNFVIKRIGAYNMTQWMQFITMRPRVVMIGNDGKVRLVREKEGLATILTNESIPDNLK